MLSARLQHPATGLRFVVYFYSVPDIFKRTQNGHNFRKNGGALMKNRLAECRFCLQSTELPNLSYWNRLPFSRHACCIERLADLWQLHKILP
jgi:hypothetical protein